jgi:hypothetical protein
MMPRRTTERLNWGGRIAQSPHRGKKVEVFGVEAIELQVVHRAILEAHSADDFGLLLDREGRVGVAVIAHRRPERGVDRQGITRIRHDDVSFFAEEGLDGLLGYAHRAGDHDANVGALLRGREQLEDWLALALIGRRNQLGERGRGQKIRAQLVGLLREFLLGDGCAVFEAEAEILWRQGQLPGLRPDSLPRLTQCAARGK